MQPQTIEQRVERLETRTADVHMLPGRIEALETRVNGLATQVADVETRSLERDRETGDHVRMLFEDVVDRIALMGEGNAEQTVQKPE